MKKLILVPEIDCYEVSLVDRPATKREWTLVRREEIEEESDTGVEMADKKSEQEVVLNTEENETEVTETETEEIEEVLNSDNPEVEETEVEETETEEVESETVILSEGDTEDNELTVLTQRFDALEEVVSSAVSSMQELITLMREKEDKDVESVQNRSAPVETVEEEPVEDKGKEGKFDYINGLASLGGDYNVKREMRSKLEEMLRS